MSEITDKRDEINEMAALVGLLQGMLMRIAVTNRRGNSTSPLTLNTGRDPLPALGVEVCAHGPGGWLYVGRVIARDAQRATYTIRVTSAANPLADKIRRLMKGETDHGRASNR